MFTYVFLQVQNVANRLIDPNSCNLSLLIIFCQFGHEEDEAILDHILWKMICTNCFYNICVQRISMNCLIPNMSETDEYSVMSMRRLIQTVATSLCQFERIYEIDHIFKKMAYIHCFCNVYVSWQKSTLLKKLHELFYPKIPLFS